MGTSYRQLHLAYSTEDEPLGTGGALAKAAAACETSNVISMNGDSYCDVSLEELWQWHRSRGGIASIQLAHMLDVSRFGSVTLDNESRIIRFEEKGQPRRPGLINAGIYCMHRGLFARVTANRAVSIEREIFPSLVKNGLFGRPGGRRFLDIGTPESYLAANAFFAATEARNRNDN